MSRTFALLALAGLIVLSSPVFADQFYFVSPGSTQWDGVYVNPYLANDNTQSKNSPVVIYCDDWNTDFSGNPTWNADVYALTAGNLPNFKYGSTTSNYNVSISAGHLVATFSASPTPFDRYLEAAWLDSQVPVSQTQQVEIAAAEWTLFVDSNHVDGLIASINNSSGYATAVAAYLEAAQNAVKGGYNAPGWDVIVPTGNSFPMQEFLVQTAVAEPTSVILMATVAGMLVFNVRSKFRA